VVRQAVDPLPIYTNRWDANPTIVETSIEPSAPLSRTADPATSKR
jgi:hypothetical protein